MDANAILKAFGEGLDIPVFALNRAYQYTYFNSAHAAVMRELYGAEIELGGALPDYQTTQDWEIARRNIARALAGENVIEAAYSGNSPANRRYFRVTHQPVSDDSGAVVGVMITAQDLTEREQVLEALRLSEQRFRGLVEKSADAIALVDAQGTVLYDSPSAPGLLGYTPEDWIGEPAFELIHPDDVSKIQQVLGELAQRPGEHTHHMFRLRHQTGRWLWIEATATNLLDDPSVGAIVVNYRDISHRVQTERLLRESEAQLREVWETTSDAMVLSDPEGRIMAANPAFMELYGYSEAEIIGESFVLIFPEEFRAQAAESYQQVFHGEAEPPAFEREVQHKDGTRRVVESQATFLTDGGTRTAMLSTIRDITQRKEAEEKLRETNRQLKVALEELRRTQHQLVRQERLAAVGQLAAGIAHDFNNILSVILLQMQLAQRAPEASPQLQERMHIVVDQAARAGDLVQQILDFSRSGVMRTRPINVRSFFNEQVDLLQRGIAETVRIQLHGPQQDMVINADPTRLQQLLTNLAFNARDAMPQGGELSIDLELLHEPSRADDRLPDFMADQPVGPWLRIRVRDSGTGISEDTLAHIFEPFFTTKEPGQGTGLGLAQVYGIVKQHNGHIDVASQPNLGTTFTIYLPVTHIVTADAEPPQQTHVPLGQGETILVVEDDLGLAQALVETLSSLNYTPLTARDGRDALACLQDSREHNTYSDTDINGVADEDRARDADGDGDTRIDLVLSDLTMPNMDGESLFRTLAAKHASLPVVILGGYDAEDKMAGLMADGLAGWLPKPPELQRLARLLDEILHSRQAG